MIKIVWLIGAIIGLVLGPGYMVYATKFSGSQVFTKHMHVQDMSAVWHEPWHFSLSEDMNLISITTKAEYLDHNRYDHYPTTDFVARLSKGQELVWKKKFNVGVKKGSGTQRGTKSQILQQFSVFGSHEYALQLRQGQRKRLSVKSIEIVVRKNTLHLNLWLTIAGFTLSFVSIGGVLMTWKK